MSLNEFMHPRNIYHTAPDFQQLAIDYPEFRKYVITDVSNKSRIDFKNRDATRELSRVLLKNDFDLDVSIPEDYLVPAIPQRLNYLLWGEDLVGVLPETNKPVTALDIGTGASCVLPLLGVRQCNWRFIATELDRQAFHYAEENVNRNQLSEFIRVLEVTAESTLCDIIPSDLIIDIIYCNPPFFSDAHEASSQHRAVVEGRSSPPGDMGGMEFEKVIPGGEVAFVQHLIEQSVQVKDKVRIFTVMLGKKSSFIHLKKKLRDQGITFVHSELCQGKTIRWGLAWTYQNIDLSKVPVLKHVKPKPPFEFIVPRGIPGMKYDVASINLRVKELLAAADIFYDVIAQGKNMCHLWVQSEQDTLTGQRRKRREKKRIEEVKKETMAVKGEPMEISEPVVQQQNDSESGTCSSVRSSVKRSADVDDEEGDAEPSLKRVKPSSAVDVPLFLDCDLRVRRRGNVVFIQIQGRNLTASREPMNRLQCYLRNKLTPSQQHVS